MLIENDATSRVRLWPRVETGIKRLKYLKPKKEAIGADQVEECTICGKSKHGQHGKTLSGTKAQSHDHNMGHLWRICANIIQPARDITIYTICRLSEGMLPLILKLGDIYYVILKRPLLPCDFG